jgi:putative alpha-1,2-mannosidase
MLTAGKFGKGSEEYGQTLPAVLEPNGMNFWTPQTRDTELKCITPYYYSDSLFQGFRNSHWIVGGCTQDYGSMTLFPTTSIKTCMPNYRATPFKHENEIATPAYYSVYLDQTRIQAEMTGRSRSAIFRFTYPADETAYLIVNPNSDEGQGFIEFHFSHGNPRLSVGLTNHKVPFAHCAGAILLFRPVLTTCGRFSRYRGLQNI